MKKTRALVVLFAPLGLLATLPFAPVACRAIVGSYEVGDAGPPDAHGPPGDTARDDTTPPIDTTPLPDTNDAHDTLPPLTACRQLGSGVGDGVHHLVLKSGEVDVWCDMSRGGYTLVALRSGKTDTTGWKTNAVSKVRRLDSPMNDTDAVLDVDWNDLGFSEVVYEIGAPPTRISFPILTPDQKNSAKTALFTFSAGPSTPHPDCVIAGTNVPACAPPPPPPGTPDQSIGWVYDPLYKTTGKDCWWGFGGSLGSQSCDTGGVGIGRVWVK